MSSTTSPSNSPEPGGAARLLQAVAAGARPTKPLRELADLGRDEVRAVALLWPALPVDARRYLTAQMTAQAEADLELNFNRVLWIALSDPDSDVRVVAIAGLWEDESEALLDHLLQSLASESDPLVREAVVTALGRFAYLLATGNLPADRGEALRDALLACARSDDPVPVRRRALESVAYRADEAVEAGIVAAYQSADRRMRLGALCAMGRTLDSRWLPELLDEMHAPDPEFRYEAVRAAGELGDPELVEPLVEMLGDEDDEVVEAAIEALGVLGGPRAISVLRHLAREGDAELRPLAQTALAQARYEQDPFRPDLS